MKIKSIKFVNFIGIYAAMGITVFELYFDHIEKSIIQIYGRNKCGKTVVIRELHPFSSIDLSGDDRNDLLLIIKGQVGIKQIVYEVGSKTYEIVHTYRPNGDTHTTSSSLMCDGVELNPSKKVTVFNQIIENIFGVNKYIFQFIINGTDLNPFGSMNSTQRKTLLNKAMGNDMYDKIHKLATDDYRYTNKLITSLNNTKEFLLSTYGSYETLTALLHKKRMEYNEYQKQSQQQQSKLDALNGKLSVLTQSDVLSELNEINSQITTYNNVVLVMGNDMRAHDELVNEQIRLNEKISTFRNEQNLINKDIDNLFDKKTKLENDVHKQQQIINDHDNMKRLMEELKAKIKAIEIYQTVSCSSDYLKSLISVAQTINGVCKEISVCLNKNHLELFHNLIKRNIDISAFLLQEGSVLMDGEKEKSVVSRIRSMVNNINGTEPTECLVDGCLYKNTYHQLDMYFKSYQSSTEHELTTYDIEQMDHAYKNIQVIRRLINMELPEEVKQDFNLINMLERLLQGNSGIDVSHLEYLLNETIKVESRNRYYEQLTNMEAQIKTMNQIVPQDNASNIINSIDIQIKQLRDKLNMITHDLDKVLQELNTNDNKRMMLSQIKHLNMKDLIKQQKRLQKQLEQIELCKTDVSIINRSYQELQQILYAVSNDLKQLEDANAQYTNTVNEIEKYLSQDKKAKIIAEATSSTKGKPVATIREKIMEALRMTNRLLNIMWDGEVNILTPTIDASQFTIPFRTGNNVSEDIRYGSQSEKSLLMAALNLSLSSLLTRYNIPLLDEIDAFLDFNRKDRYIEMIVDVMAVLKIEQLFIISHNIAPNEYEHLIHTIDISNSQH